MATAPVIPMKEGYLDLKCGHIWKKSYFVITKNKKLFCFEEDKDKVWDVKFVHMRGRDNNKFVFEVLLFCNEINKSWILGASTDEDRNDWIQALSDRIVKSRSMHDSLTLYDNTAVDKPPPVPPRIRTNSVGVKASATSQTTPPPLQSQFILNEQITRDVHFYPNNSVQSCLNDGRQIVRPSLIPSAPPMGGNISMPLPNQQWNNAKPTQVPAAQSFPLPTQQPPFHNLQYPTNNPPMPPYPSYYPAPPLLPYGNQFHFSSPPPPPPSFPIQKGVTQQNVSSDLHVHVPPNEHTKVDNSSHNPATNKPPVINSKSTPFHTVEYKNIRELLKDNSIDPNAKDTKGCTALHWYMFKKRKNRHGLLMRCLESGRPFDVNARDNNSLTPLHFAAWANDLQYVKILMAFGADITCKSDNGRCPYEMTGDPKIRELLTPFDSYSRQPLRLFLPQRDELCNINELKHMPIGKLITPQAVSRLVQLIDYEIMQQEEAPYQTLNPSFQTSADALIAQRKYLNSWNETAGTKVLFLDGGGIRGLVQIEILMELERRTGCRVVNLFDYIVGTSTGGIVALGLVYAKKTLSEMKQIYLQIKDKVFAAASKLPMAYMHMEPNSQNLEKILKSELGDVLMSSVKKPRVMISVVVNRKTPELQFFNNFMIDSSKELTDIPVWMAARATSAAPVYFTPFQDKYIDGGVMANNPCQEAMKVITDYDKKCGIPYRHFGLIISIGTGQYMANEESDKPDKGMSLLKHFIQIREIVNLFLKQLSTSESKSQIFGAWCEKARRPIPFYRFNPEFTQDVSSAETDDTKIIDLIVDTKKYLRTQEVLTKIDCIMALFQKFGE